MHLNFVQSIFYTDVLSQLKTSETTHKYSYPAHDQNRNDPILTIDSKSDALQFFLF